MYGEWLALHWVLAGKVMLHIYLYTCFSKAHCCLSVVVSGHVEENQEISFTKGGTESD